MIPVEFEGRGLAEFAVRPEVRDPLVVQPNDPLSRTSAVPTWIITLTAE